MNKNTAQVLKILLIVFFVSVFLYFFRDRLLPAKELLDTDQNQPEAVLPDLSNAKFLVEIDVHPTLGNILIDSESGGKTLYYSLSSTQAEGHAGGEECDGWTPRWAPDKLPASAAPSGVLKDLSLNAWSNGQYQLAYIGKPLFLYDGDVDAGEINGEGKCKFFSTAVVEGDPYTP